MPILLWIWNNKRWTLIIILICLLIWQTCISNSLSGELDKSKSKHQDEIKAAVDKALKPYLDAEKEAQINANKVSENYEQSKTQESVKTETVTREVQKIIERPVYIHTNCFDDDGVSAANAAGNASKP